MPFLITRARELRLALAAAETHAQNLRDDLAAVEETAATQGLAAKLAEALTPKGTEPTPHTRIRAVKHFKAFFRGMEYSGASGTVNDLPTALLRDLKGRVEVVPPNTELVGLPLQPWMRTDD